MCRAWEGMHGVGHLTLSHFRNQCEAIQRAGTRRSYKVASPTPTSQPTLPSTPQAQRFLLLEVLEIPKPGALNYFRGSGIPYVHRVLLTDKTVTMFHTLTSFKSK